MINLKLDRPLDVISVREDAIIFPHILLSGITAYEQFEPYRRGRDSPIQAYGLKDGLRKDIGGLVLSHYMVLQLDYMGINVVYWQDADTMIDMTTLDSLLEIATTKKEGEECLFL